MTFANVYAHRKVADTASRGCDICFRATTSVLVSDGADGKDFFFVCPSHLKDKNFCSPIIDQEAVEARRKKKELDEEVERVKREYEERKKKKEAEKDDKKKDGEDDEKKKKDDAKDKDKDSKADDKKKDDEDSKKTEDSASLSEPEPRIFALHRTFYQQRIEKKRQAEMARRNRERLQQPDLFPSVPKNLPGT